MRYYGNHNDYSLSPLRNLAYNQAAIADAYSDSAARARTDGQAGHSAGLGFGGSGTKITADPGKNAAMESGNMMQQAMRAMESAFANEQAAVQDRQLDLAENNLAMNSADRRYEAELQNDASKYASDAMRLQPVGNYGGAASDNQGNPLQGLYANAPNINLYSSDGQRIGGSYYRS